MEQKSLRFLKVSLIAILLLCISVFTVMTKYMIDENNKTMNEVGNIYMTEISCQLQRHFKSIIDLRLSMVKSIISSNPPKNTDEFNEQFIEELTTSGKVREFDYLALYSRDGNTDVIYGENLEIEHHQAFLNSLNNDDPKLVIGTTTSGKKLLILGVSIGFPSSKGYPMTNGKQCTALLAGIPLEYLNYTMSLDVNEALIYSHIVRKDGSFVQQNAGSNENNYFNMLLNHSANDDVSIEKAVQEMETAFSKGENYSIIVNTDGKRQYLYCLPLPDSEWYLVSVMPYNKLDSVVSGLGIHRMYVTLGSCIIIISALLLIYFFYYHLSRKQIKALEIARQEAERANRAKSDFLSNMSHDIRTPMNAIMGMTAIAKTNIDKPDRLRYCLKKITLSSKHLLGLINDILDMSKIESGKLIMNMDAVSLREITESVVNIVQPQIKIKKQQFDVFIHNIQTEQIYCDSVRLTQILLNLLSNAIKFTPEKGSIDLTILQENSPKGDEFIRTHFWVKDTGIGMSPEFQEQIFNSFVREDKIQVRKIEGTGLGMTITKYIVDEMGGSIDLQSEPDKGATFHVTLDLKQVLVSEEDMILPNWQMLVVDNDELLCQSVVSSLKEIGIHADWALNAVSAIEMTEQRIKEKNNYHIILLDWDMPEMNGVEAARELRKRVGKNIPILLISAYDWGDIEEEARDAGISGFIPKPLFKSTLFHGLNHFSNLIDEKNQEPEIENIDGCFNCRILLVEDNDLNWEIANELLTNHSFIVERAENGKICVDKFINSNIGYYDAILMDIRMPIMNGYEATKIIVNCDRDDANIPIIAMTADAFSEDIQNCIKCGMVAHVPKPLDVQGLLRTLKKYICLNKN